MITVKESVSYKIQLCSFSAYFYSRAFEKKPSLKHPIIHVEQTGLDLLKVMKLLRPPMSLLLFKDDIIE